MALFFQLAFWLHVVAGGVALSVFWIPLVTKKGGPLHRRVGWVYVGAAATIAVTAFVNCARMLTDGIPRNDRAGVFLAYVGLLAAESALHGVRALGTKGRTSGARSPIDVAPAALLGAGGMALAVYGLRVATPLYLAFGVLGLALATGHLRFWLRAPVTRREWFYAHMTGMGTSCITTVTAFVVVNAHRFGLGTFSPLVWLTPTAVGATGLLLWRRRLSPPSPMAPRVTAFPFASKHGDGDESCRESSGPVDS